MEKIFEQALLYDFYGELLTEHQRSIYEDVVYNDMSLGEIAEERGISRQGVHDLLKRCDKILQEYEAKLHLVGRFVNAKGKIAEIVELTRLPSGSCDEGCAVSGQEAVSASALMAQRMERIRELSGQLLQELW